MIADNEDFRRSDGWIECEPPDRREQVVPELAHAADRGADEHRIAVPTIEVSARVARRHRNMRVECQPVDEARLIGVGRLLRDQRRKIGVAHAAERAAAEALGARHQVFAEHFLVEADFGYHSLRSNMSPENECTAMVA